ncbi:MAG: stage II sporulation protein M [Limnochordales bacterium]|nr:stage II sporulation protein M [Limnochordales bacterium]
MGFWRIYLENRWHVLVLVVFILLVGAIAGAGWALTLPEDELSSLQELLESFHQSAWQATGAAPAELFRQGVKYDVLRTIGLLYLIGLSWVGAPLILLMIFARGFALGFTAAILVTPLSWRGLIVGTAALLPQNLLLVPAVVVAAVASLHFSWVSLASLLAPRKEWRGEEAEIRRQFLAATAMVLLAAGMATLANLVTAYVTPLLLTVLTGWLA